MNAEALIAEIKKLPPSEFEKVRQFIRAADEEADGPSAMREMASPYAAGLPRVRYADDAAFRKAVDHVFTEHRELLRLLAQ